MTGHARSDLVGSFDLSGKTAILCGLWEGIGEQVAQCLSRQGVELFIIESDERLARSVVSSIEDGGGRASLLPHDAASSSGISAAFAKVGADRNRLDILVTTANRGHWGDLLETREDDLDAMYHANIKSVFYAMKAALPFMLEAGGAIVNVGSVFAHVALKERFAYMMTKGALVSMTRSVAADYADRNVRCNCVCPARVDTAFVRDWIRTTFPGREQETLQELSAYQPLGRMGRPEEVASLILYLCSDEGAFVTGQAYSIDGGVTAL